MQTVAYILPDSIKGVYRYPKMAWELIPIRTLVHYFVDYLRKYSHICSILTSIYILNGL